MTDQRRAQLIVDEWLGELREGLEVSAGALRLLESQIVKALTLARSEGREEGMKELLSRRDICGLIGRQPAAPAD